MKLRVHALAALFIAAAFVITPSPVSQGQASSASEPFHADQGLYGAERREEDFRFIDRETLKAVESILPE